MGEMVVVGPASLSTCLRGLVSLVVLPGWLTTGVSGMRVPDPAEVMSSSAFPCLFRVVGFGFEDATAMLSSSDSFSTCPVG